MNQTPENKKEMPRGELRAYPGGHVDEVYKQPGLRFPLATVLDRVNKDTLATDVGCVYVQTRDQEGKGHRYYFDGVNAINPEQPWMVANTGLFNKATQDHPSTDIEIGQSWYSPHGVTHQVEAVVIPYTSGVDGVGITQMPPDAVSPTMAGRQIMNDTIAANAQV